MTRAERERAIHYVYREMLSAPDLELQRFWWRKMAILIKHRSAGQVRKMEREYFGRSL